MTSDAPVYECVWLLHSFAISDYSDVSAINYSTLCRNRQIKNENVTMKGKHTEPSAAYKNFVQFKIDNASGWFFFSLVYHFIGFCPSTFSWFSHLVFCSSAQNVNPMHLNYERIKRVCFIVVISFVWNGSNRLMLFLKQRPVERLFVDNMLLSHHAHARS